MRLLRRDNENGITLTQHSEDELPPYAILSHTWGPDGDEVSFADLQNNRGQEKHGYKKINFCSKQAEKDDIEYFWVDTCCIDKTSSSELSEAITRMFRWYQEADVCYVYLADVVSYRENNGGGTDQDQTVRSWKPSFRRSRWFKRGWTLQELLAPEHVVFFSKDGDQLGTKTTLVRLIHEITDIPTSALENQPLDRFPSKERMRWADGRITKKEEDQAYCLLGLLGVYMCIRYGEGRHAFQRLRIEVEIAELGREDERRRAQERQEDEERQREKRRRDLSQSLYFETMDSRRSTIRSADSSTCTWFLDNPTYTRWSGSGQHSRKGGFLWIVGKPGAGKSTLMKFIHAHADGKKVRGEIVIAFFFNARGNAFEKSTLGMYRALLYELLHRLPDLQGIFDDVIPFPGYFNQTPVWTIELLCKLLSTAIAKLGQRRLRCFIDALDECDEQQIREAVDFFEELAPEMASRGAQLHVCFASRHYPTIDIRNGQKLILEDQDGHSKDLLRYVQGHLRIGTGEYAEDIRVQIQERASGVFMWVVLVIAILNAEFRRGRIFAVRKRLREIPDELSDLFRDIINRDAVNRDDLLLCLQWIAFARRPLRPEEFYYAMVSGLDPEPDNLMDPIQVAVDDMERFVINSSKGLAELTKSHFPAVQFIHESIRDFLIKENGLKKLWNERHDANVAASSHDRLKHCCEVYLSVSVSTHKLVTSEPPPKGLSEPARNLRQWIGEQFPFLEYATQNIFHHANEAAEEVPQADFLSNFPLDGWIRISNLFEPYAAYAYTIDVNFLYIFAENNFSRLIATLGPQDLVVNNREERYQNPFFAAMANSHRDAVRALLRSVKNDQVDEIVTRLHFNRDFSAFKGQTPLLWALEKQHEALAELLSTSIDTTIRHTTHRASSSPLRKEDDSVEAEDGQGRTAFVLAAYFGYERVVQILLDKGAKVNSQEGPCGNALQAASHKGHEKVVQILLDNGANVNARGGRHGNALQAALCNGHENVVEMLLRSGADLHAQEGYLGNSLQAVSHSGHERLTQMLLDKGVDVNAQCGYLRNALQAAAYRGHEKVVQILLGRGANVNARGGRFNDALQAASCKGHKRIVQILLDAGADVNARGGEYGSALRAALIRGHEKVAQILGLHRAAKTRSTGPAK